MRLHCQHAEEGAIVGMVLKQWKVILRIEPRDGFSFAYRTSDTF